MDAVQWSAVQWCRGVPFMQFMQWCSAVECNGAVECRSIRAVVTWSRAPKCREQWMQWCSAVQFILCNGAVRAVVWCPEVPWCRGVVHAESLATLGGVFLSIHDTAD